MKAIGLLSGGLDSTLAVKLMIEQGLEVIAVKFTSPFCQCDSGGCCHAAEAARRMGVPLKLFAKGEDYLEVIRHPKHGYGSAMNPCIDCRIFMLKKTRVYMDEIGAGFMFTGEVLGQRPMSQHRRALEAIEREAGVEGKILRPLSARHLPPTEAELKGWVNREKLLALEGRSRKPQIQMAEDMGITDYPCPAGGCLLTDRNFATKLRDLFAHTEPATMRDIHLLKIGRHFRFGGVKFVAGRDAGENDRLRKLKAPPDTVFEVVDSVGPTVLLCGPAIPENVRFAAGIVAAYSDAAPGDVTIAYGPDASGSTYTLAKPTRESLQAYYV